MQQRRVADVGPVGIGRHSFQSMRRILIKVRPFPPKALKIVPVSCWSILKCVQGQGTRGARRTASWLILGQFARSSSRALVGLTARSL